MQRYTTFQLIIISNSEWICKNVSLENETTCTGTLSKLLFLQGRKGHESTCVIIVTILSEIPRFEPPGKAKISLRDRRVRTIGVKLHCSMTNRWNNFKANFFFFRVQGVPLYLKWYVSIQLYCTFRMKSTNILCLCKLFILQREEWSQAVKQTCVRGH